ncbi:DUF6545 domain-containing protein [Streptomyces sp. NBC_00162]|uniref:DUF6545 domain-containing protein n=1 Tax=Streptomyces sp. NBC_00162 TaxID=2903629 RepID=UPI003A4C709E
MGSPDPSVLIKHLAGLASNYFILEYVITVHGRGPRRAATARVFGPRVGRARDLFVLGDRTLDVAHRAFEIRDACLVLRDRSVATRPEGPGADSDAPLEGGEPDARAEAVWLFAALHGNAGSGHPPSPVACQDSQRGDRMAAQGGCRPPAFVRPAGCCRKGP